MPSLRWFCISRVPFSPHTVPCSYNRLRITVRIRNVPANHFVASARRASRDFALFFARYDSFCPVNAESPEFLPDCSMIMHMRETLIRSWIAIIIVLIISIVGSILSADRKHGIACLFSQCMIF